jgi:hypothetical protein
MGMQTDGSEEFSNNKVVGEPAQAAIDSDDQIKSASSSKPKKQKVAKRPKPAAGKTAGQEKLVCRYCGSDDLAPSFKKRRDARCRACFKKRYSSSAPRKNTTKTKATRKTKRTRAAKAAG